MTTLILKYEYPSSSVNRTINLKLQEIIESLLKRIPALEA
jgi:hypothetical protein